MTEQRTYTHPSGKHFADVTITNGVAELPEHLLHAVMIYAGMIER